MEYAGSDINHTGRAVTSPLPDPKATAHAAPMKKSCKLASRQHSTGSSRSLMVDLSSFHSQAGSTPG
jgi:hypothetical protein